MKKLNNVEELEQKLYHEKLVNKLLVGENEELKKINAGMRIAYEDLKWMEAEYKELVKYKRYIPYIDRFRRSLLFRVMRKIRNIFRRGNHE